MRHTLRFIAVLAAVAASTGCQAAKKTDTSAQYKTPAVEEHTLQAAREQADFVFAGTVQKVGASSMPRIAGSERTIVVRVDQVVTAPESVELRPGDTVTMAVGKPGAFAAGAQMLFYADAWMYGSGLALVELAHDTQLTAAAGARQAVQNARFAARIRGADMVVLGMVQSTRAAPAAGARRVTEHDPMWQEAVVKVKMGIKGAEADQTVVVRFPGSMDVAWYRAPKLKQGQEATLFMKRDEVTGLAPAKVEGKEIASYTALAPQDVMGAAAAERIQMIAKAMPK